jgi:hypothetical protein
MFKKCIENANIEMWQIMEEYNIQDVVVLMDVYNRLRPWMTNSPIVTETSQKCNKCQSYRIIKRGTADKNGHVKYFQRFQCKDCGGWGQYKL